MPYHLEGSCDAIIDQDHLSPAVLHPLLMVLTIGRLRPVRAGLDEVPAHRLSVDAEKFLRVTQLRRTKPIPLRRTGGATHGFDGNRTAPRGGYMPNQSALVSVAMKGSPCSRHVKLWVGFDGWARLRAR